MPITVAQHQANACALVGEAPVNALFEVLLPLAVSGGTFNLSYEGQETEDLAYNISAQSLESALQVLATIGDNGAAVEGLRTGPYQIELVGENGGQPAGSLTGDGSNLEPPATLTPNLIQEGRPSRIASDAAVLWEKYESTSDADLRYLYTARDLCLLQMGRYVRAVDQRDGNEESKDSGVGVNLRGILNDINRQIGDLQAVEVQTSSGTVFPMPIARGVAVRNDYSIRRYITGRV